MELKFNSDTRHRKQWFTGISFSHPAKMILPLQLWIIENYTKPGDVVLDPMAGSGTILTACSMGRHVIAVELEDKFVKMMQGNWEKVQQRGPQLGYEMGTAQIIQGDARNLKGLMVDKCVFSPPYAEAQSGGGIAVKGYQGDKHSPTDLVGKRSYMPDIHGQTVGQIGNLPYGTIDSVVTSPPYINRMDGGVRGPRAGMIPYTDESPDAWFTQRDQENIGNLRYGEISAVVTSPPYENQGQGQGKEYHPERMVGTETGLGRGYSEDEKQIGNLKGDTYLEAMLLVYQQCHLVLKPGGIMVLVTKDFIRDKKHVDLAGDTIKLCETAGFTFNERHYRKITTQSFWRTIYHQKYPEVEPIKFEDVMVFTK